MAAVAYAVVRTEPPQVYVASDVEVLQRVLALELVARTPPAALDAVERTAIRAALLDEQWGDAVVAWIERMGVAVDVYTHLHVWSEDDLPAELVGAQLQFAPLFREPA